MVLSISVSVCVSVCQSVCHLLSFTYHSENQKCKNGFCRFLHLPSNGVIAKIVLCDLDLHLEGQRFELRPSHWRTTILLSFRIKTFPHSDARCTSKDSNRDLFKVVKAHLCPRVNDYSAVSADLPPLVRHPPSSCSCFDITRPFIV